MFRALRCWFPGQELNRMCPWPACSQMFGQILGIWSMILRKKKKLDTPYKAMKCEVAHIAFQLRNNVPMTKLILQGASLEGLQDSEKLPMNWVPPSPYEQAAYDSWIQRTLRFFLTVCYERSPYFSWVNINESTNEIAIFHSKLLVHQRVSLLTCRSLGPTCPGRFGSEVVATPRRIRHRTWQR